MRATETFKRSTLDLDTAKKIIDRAASNGVTALSFTGGEPLLFLEQVAELIQICTQRRHNLYADRHERLSFHESRQA